MKRFFLVGIVCMTMLSSGCFGLLGKKVGGDDKSVTNKKTQVAGAIVEAKVGVEATGVKAKKIKVTGVEKAEATVDAKAVDLSKKTEISGGQHIEGVDMKTLCYLAGGVFSMMSSIIVFMGTMLTASYRRMKEKDVIILDLANDIKEILPKVMESLRLAYETGFDIMKKK